ncbi:ATP-binding protein [Streptomyces albogriseolus]|uniref:ATP-binding protein n=2 Tax=Streptomyces albogriseolus TaxID=1887 RepID=UPI0036A3E8C3
MKKVMCPSRGGPIASEQEPRRTECPRTGAARALAVATLPACPRAVSRLRRLMAAVALSHRLPAAAEEALAVIVSELATNVVLHSGSPDLTVTLTAECHSLTLEVRDQGRWRDRSAPRCEATDMDAEFGRGLALVDAYAVDRSVRRDAWGTLVRAVVAL